MGIETYFAEYSFKNTELGDFIRHMNDAAIKVGIKEDFKGWCDTWLKTAGCNIIWHEVEADKPNDGVIKKFVVQQRVHKHGKPTNRLRKQKYRVDFLDKQMRVVAQHDVFTRADAETIEIKELAGKPMPYAFHINAGNYGFAKFKIDAMSLKAFEADLAKMESSMSRKQLYCIMLDMIKENDLSGAQLFEICAKQIVKEEAVDVLSEVFKSIIPEVMADYLPSEALPAYKARLFELVDAKLKAGADLDKATRHLLLDTLISSARTKEQLARLRGLFESKTADSAHPDTQPDVSVKHRHAIVKAFFKSKEATAEEREAMMTALDAIPEGKDNLELTRRYCEAAEPSAKSKEATWEKYFDFSDESPIKDWGLQYYQSSMAGFNQASQTEELAPYADKFFASVRQAFEKKGRFVAEVYFLRLKPMSDTSDTGIAKYEKLLADVRSETPDATHLIDLLRDAIEQLQQSRKGQEMSRAWIKANKIKV